MDEGQVRYQDVIMDLRAAYDGGAQRRDQMTKEQWKLTERAAFQQRLTEAGCRRLLEVGAGTGQDSLYFQEHGFDVVATDLSEQMVERCRVKGLDARVMDFLHLDFPAGWFDAVYAVNCLLHVPDADLPAVLLAIRQVLRPGGWFYFGVYGGQDEEGPADQDLHDPPRFFSRRSDERIQRFALDAFDLVDFHVVRPGKWTFQSLTLRRP